MLAAAGILAAGVLAAATHLLRPPLDRLATHLPGGTAVYATVHLDPSLRQKMAFGDVAGHLGLRDEDGAAARELGAVIDEVVATAGLRGAAAVAPWIDDQIGVFVLGGGGPWRLGAIATVRDHGAARSSAAEAVARLADEPPRETDIGGVTAHVAGGIAGGVVDDVLVVADATAFRAVATTPRDDALDRHGEFADAFAGLPVDHLARVFVDPSRLRGAPADSISLPGRAAGTSLAGLLPVPGLAPLQPDDTWGAVVYAREASLVVASAAPADAVRPSPPAVAVADLPADAWLALALTTDDGRTLPDVLGRFAAPVRSLGRVRSIAGFVSGRSLVDVEAGALVDVDGSGDAQRVALRLARALGLGTDRTSGTPGVAVDVPVLGDVVVGATPEGDLVVATGADAAERLTGHGEALADGRRFGGLRAAVGRATPLLFVDVQAVLRMTQAVGLDPVPEKARRWVRSVGAVLTAVEHDGDRIVVRTAVGFGDGG